MQQSGPIASLLRSLAPQPIQRSTILVALDACRGER